VTCYLTTALQAFESILAENEIVIKKNGRLERGRELEGDVLCCVVLCCVVLCCVVCIVCVCERVVTRQKHFHAPDFSSRGSRVCFLNVSHAKFKDDVATLLNL
jgi:hypothetical protein